jgi:hypothetical protein
MWSIRKQMAQLRASIKGWLYLWNWKRVAGGFLMTGSCINCGPVPEGIILVSCRMVDRCIASQNSDITRSLSQRELEEVVYSGRRVYAETGRPMCLPCAEANHYVCFVCELEASKETSK